MNSKTRNLIIGAILLCAIGLGLWLALGYTGRTAPSATSGTQSALNSQHPVYAATQTIHPTNQPYNPFPVEPGTFKNLLFERVFPQVSLVASCQLGVLEQPNVCTTEAVWGQKEYWLPYDFNQLMVDYGYSLDEQTRDDLAHAFIVTGLPLEVATQPMTCDPGEVIDEIINLQAPEFGNYGYRMVCHTSVGDLVAKFYRFTDQFRVVSIRKTDDSPFISFNSNRYK